MPELLIELFSEEIPARMQARGADDLARLVADALAALAPAGVRTFHGPRRIALSAEVEAAVPARSTVERGPRVSAPEAALLGFLRKHGAAREALAREGEFLVLRRETPPVEAAELIAGAMPGLLRRFPWPKSMRWGGGSAFTWVRPLRRILCLLDGRVVPFDLRDGADDGHGLRSGDETEGHRFMAPGPVAVRSVAGWRDALRRRCVVAEAGERRRMVADGIAGLAAGRGLAVVADPGLLDEVAGLVEWPVPLLGRIDPAFMDLPAEVMQVSMRVNQRYFALRDAEGRAAPFFGFAANVEAADGGATIVAGNERVLRARFADARHFWDLDRKTELADRVPALKAVTFHAKLGSQWDRVQRLVALAPEIATAVGADPALARRAALLAKADLTTGMVGEFPELQGVMGGYYARHDGEDARVADAVRDHYAPKGPSDPVPAEPVAMAVALADKLDQLAAFFSIGEAPTGSGDPFALRRAALGVIRIVVENRLALPLLGVISRARGLVTKTVDRSVLTTNPGQLITDVRNFILERLRVKLRAEGARHDVLSAVLALGADDDLNRLLARTEAIAGLLGTEDGANLLTAYRRAANILRIEEKRDGKPAEPRPDPGLLVEPQERAVAEALDAAQPEIDRSLAVAMPGAILSFPLTAEHFTAAMSAMSRLRAPLDAFFDRVTVNVTEPELRRNRLALLNRVRATMNRVADFSKIEG